MAVVHSGKERIGISSTVPVEVVYASGCVPVDLNNAFISWNPPQILIDEAERQGMPRTVCAWVKGVYSVIRNTNINVIIGVMQGDCAPMTSMLQLLMPLGVEFIPFSYPYDQDRQLLRREVQKLMEYFGVQWDAVEEAKKRLDVIRKLAHEIDRRTWELNSFSGQENLYALVNCTDFKSDPDVFQMELDAMLRKPPRDYPADEIRLGLLGVPGVFSDLYSYLEERGARVVFNEIARQFAMPEYAKDLLDQNLNYTYPYSVFGRLRDIQEQAQIRQLDGYIHYIQAFCHHQLEDQGFRQHLKMPVLSLEGDRVGPLDGRTRTRLDAFLHMLRHKKKAQHGSTRH
ncbi:MAG: 2-hydroxyacyl-CoA dehydratase family protein [candidate division FCPU426 bacterium]